jgi:integrase/recombinase XerD
MKLNGENGVIAHYLLDCRTRNLSQWTLSSYDRVLHLLADLLCKLCKIEELEQVTVLHLRQCVQYISSPSLQDKDVQGLRQDGKTLSAHSVRGYILVWKAFFNWCYQEELIEKSPVTRLKTPVLEKRIKPTLSAEDLQKMLDMCDRKTALGFRDYTILSLLADTGLRLAEIASLKVGDVYPSYIKVFGKGRREREVGVHPEVSKLIWKYVQKYRKPSDAGEMLLFLGRWGKPLGRSGVSAVVEQVKEKCGFEDKQVTPHVFRHTFSKQYMQRGGDVLSLSRELGHSDIQVTRLYLQDFGSEEARKDHNSRSIFNDIEVSKRRKSRRRQEE